MKQRQLLLILLLSVFSIYQTRGALALVITSPQNGATFNEGETITIRVMPSAEDPDFRFVQIFSPPGAESCPELASPSYECNVSIPAGSPRTLSINALGRSSSGTLVETGDITIFVR